MAKDDGVILPYCTGGVCMSVCFHRLAAPGQLVLFAMGGTAYLALEIAWRGTTHWTMFLAGGACLCALDALGRLPLPTPLLAGIGSRKKRLSWLVCVRESLRRNRMLSSISRRLRQKIS